MVKDLPLTAIILCLLIAAAFIAFVVYIVNRGAPDKALKRGGVIRDAVLLEIHQTIIMSGTAAAPITKMLVEVVHRGTRSKYNITVNGSKDLQVGSRVKVIVNFATGECGLFE